MNFMSKNIFVKTRLTIMLLLLGIDLFFAYFNNPLIVCQIHGDLGFCDYPRLPDLPLAAIVSIVAIILFVAYCIYRICWHLCQKFKIDYVLLKNILLNSLIVIFAISACILYFFDLHRTLPSVGTFLSYPADFSNNQNLIGGASNVFVAKVIAQTGNKETSVGPRTQYSVEIIQNIKGDLSGIVTLDQLGGYKNGQLVTVEDATLEGYLLQPGATYLLATRYNEQENWYTLNPHPNASKLLSSDANLDKKELKALVDKDAKVKSLEAAYPNEHLLDADIAHNNTRNNYKSLPPEAKAAAQSRADAAKASFNVSATAQ